MSQHTPPTLPLNRRLYRRVLHNRVLQRLGARRSKLRLPILHLLKWLRPALAGILVVLLIQPSFAQAPATDSSPASSESPTAQPRSSQRPKRVRRGDIWKAVYQQLPELPREDSYVDRASNQPSSSTLVQRLLTYHSSTRGRSPYHRFDWKLTLADYLGKNEIMAPELYPSGTRFTQNPMEGDRQALSQLDRAQRDELINAIVSLYNPRVPPPIAVTAEDPGPILAPTPSFTPAPAPERPTLAPTPQPGDAELLLPR